jgi:hypothetical protein
MVMAVVRLVNSRNIWAVCELATIEREPDRYDMPGDIPETYEAWLHVHDRTIFCAASPQVFTYTLPSYEAHGVGFFDDRFPFAIDAKSDFSDNFIEKIGGMNNCVAAVAAFDVLVHAEGKNTTVTLRHGSRIIRRERGRGDFSDWFREQNRRDAG